MNSSLSGQMLVAYDKSRSRVAKIQERYATTQPVFRDVEVFGLRVRNRFLLGVHSAYSKKILECLKHNLGAQQVIAEALGLKDRTSISQMLRSGTMDGIRITAALHQFRGIITLPTAENAALHGFARATSFIKAQVHQDDSIEGTMTAQEFSNLVGVLASDEWDNALRDTNPSVARAVAVRIVEQREIAPEGNARKRRPEQVVLTLRELQETWGDYGAVALCWIPDCIPQSDAATEGCYDSKL